MKRFALLTGALAVAVAAVVAAASWFWNPQLTSYLPAQVRALLADGAAVRGGANASVTPARAAPIPLVRA